MVTMANTYCLQEAGLASKEEAAEIVIGYLTSKGIDFKTHKKIVESPGFWSRTNEYIESRGGCNQILREVSKTLGNK